MSGNFRSPRPVTPAPTVTTPADVFWRLVFSVVLFTVAWNYGVTEVIQSLGGPDANINILEGTLTFLFTRLVVTR